MVALGNFYFVFENSSAICVGAALRPQSSSSLSVRDFRENRERFRFRPIKRLVLRIDTPDFKLTLNFWVCYFIYELNTGINQTVELQQ